MRATLGESATETRVCPPSLRLVLVAFEVRMWRILDWPRLNLPVPVFLKRFAAPLCVFNLGMMFLTKCCFRQPSEYIRVWLVCCYFSVRERGYPPPPLPWRKISGFNGLRGVSVCKIFILKALRVKSYF